MMVLVYDRSLNFPYSFSKNLFEKRRGGPKQRISHPFWVTLSSLFLSNGMVASLAGEDLTCSQDDLFSLVTVNGIWHCLEF